MSTPIHRHAPDGARAHSPRPVQRTRLTAFPATAGVLLGIGLGGFFDGIVLHQLLQWHHMLSNAGVPPDSLEGLRINVMADGLFHAATYAFTLAGLALLWRSARRAHLPWSGRGLPGALLLGFGLFNVVEGTVNHFLLGIHHVNETVAPEQWIYWDAGFLIWGLVMVLAGLLMLRRAQREDETFSAAMS
jgi:uncharacterized membrane protein